MENYTHGNIRRIDVVDEMKTAFIDYSMSVITSRALPDVRDGLKPVHRRILYALYKLGLTSDKSQRKSSHIVGNVLANYHPHGDAAVYEAMVRLAQDFSMRYPLVDGQGNFGNVDGYPAAAMRYTEARMSRLAEEMLKDIDKNTVDFMFTYDQLTEEPTVLPSRFPNLLVNGSSGIAVGMATNIPPHNLRDIEKAIIAYYDDPDISIDALTDVIGGPDFPTGGMILGTKGIRDAYTTGRGAITVRGETRIEEMKGGKHRIIITELPYQVNKARLVEKIAQLVKDKELDGITALRDETDRTGMRVVVELRRDVNPNIMLNKLFKMTQLQENFNVIMLSLVDGVPEILTIKDMIRHYTTHQEEVVRRRTQFELDKAMARAHIVEGLQMAVDHIDEVIKIIRSSYNDQESKSRLGERFGMSDKQAQAVIEMQLRRLQGLNREKLAQELEDLKAAIAYYESILASHEKLVALVLEELATLTERHGDERRTRIMPNATDELDMIKLIADEDVVITVSHEGYIKRMPMDVYRKQHRGGRGVASAKMKEDDWIEQLFITTNHQELLFFTSAGKVLRLKAYAVPEAGRTAKGTAIVNLLNIQGERIEAVLTLREFSPDRYLFIATKKGKVKKTELSSYDTNRRDGILALRLDDDDEVVGVTITDGDEDIILVSRQGYAMRFPEEEVRPQGRVTGGVIGIRLDEGDEVINMGIAQDAAELLVVSENGYGKRTPLKDYTARHRAGKGVLTIKASQRNGLLAAALVVRQGEEVMIISREGTLIRTSVSGITSSGRNTQGVRIMRMQKEDEVIDACRIVAED